MIEVKELVKYFGAKRAVDHLSFSVNKGEILGFLGPNGAGKSTTMRMITGFIPPSSGTAAIGGKDIIDDSLAAREKLGYLPENAPVYPDMTVFDYLSFCAQVRNMGPKKNQQVGKTLERCFLTKVQNQMINTLSKGYKQRVCFAQSILHDPEYLIMDEPTDGLDPNQKHEVRQMIRDMSSEKVIILSTHILDEVEALCSRAIIIANGKIVADDTPENLKLMDKDYGTLNLTVNTGDSEDIIGLIRKIVGVRDIWVSKKESNQISLQIQSDTRHASLSSKVVKTLASNEIEIGFISEQQGRLDQVFRQVTAEI